MNEILLLGTAVFSVAFVWVSWRLGKEHLYTAIIIFLTLIPTVGGKIVEFFGYETNTGNIFYASVFLSTYFLTERYGRKEGLRSIWIGIAGAAFFGVLANLSTFLEGTGATAPLDTALNITFGASVRIAIASLIAYVFSQNLNVRLYIFLKEKMKGSRLWLRANIANAVSQILDSVVFFVVAFWGVILPGNIVEIIAMGLILKIIFMMLASPLLYFNTIEYEESKSYSTISVH